MGSAFVRRVVPTSRRHAVLYNAAPTPPPGGATDLTGTATYYVDSVNGLDTNNGTSAATPKKTLAAVPTLSTGGTIALKAGSEFREAIPVVHTGTSGTPLVWGMYGTGTRPKVKGSKDYGTALSWSLTSGSIYQAAATGLPTGSNLVYIDELTPLRKYASLAALQAGAAGGYFADTTNSILYVWMKDGSNPALHRVEVNSVVGVMMNTPKAYTTVQDLQVMHGSGGNAGIFSFSTNAGVVVQRCVIGPHFGAGIYVGSTGMLVQDCLVQTCWDAIDYPGTAGSGIGIFMGAGTNATGITVRRNWVTGCTHGIRGNGSQSADVYLNYVYLNHVNGIDIIAATTGTGEPIRVVFNTVWHRPDGATPAGHALDQQVSGTGLMSKYNVVFTDFTGSGSNIEAYCLASGAGSNTFEDDNLGWVDPASTGVYGKVGSTTYSTAAAYWAATQATYGASNNAHSINADPKFVSLGNNDPRLTPGSPAIAAGGTVTGITDTDTANFTASPPNLGAFQTVATLISG